MIDEKMWGNYQDRLNTHWMIARDEKHILSADAIRILQGMNQYELVNIVLDYANGLIRPKKGGKKYRYEDYQRFVKMMDRCHMLCIKKIKEERKAEIQNCGTSFEIWQRKLKMIKNEFAWPKNLADILNKHWVMEQETNGIIRNDIFWTVYRVSNKGAKLIEETLAYISGYARVRGRSELHQYTIDDAKKVLSMLDEIGRIFNVSRKIERKNEILDCTEGYEV